VNFSEQYTAISQAAVELQESSDYLTEETRLFVLSNDLHHLNNYFHEVNVTKRREKALESINSYHNGSVSFDLLQQALEESKQLQELEYTAMKLVVAGNHFDQDPAITIPEEIKNTELDMVDAMLSDNYKTSKAWLLLFSQDYLSAKLRISDLKSRAIGEILSETKNAHDASLEDLKSVFIRLIISVFGVFILSLVFFIGIIKLVIKPLYGFIQNIRENKKLEKTKARELNILSETFNEMYDRNEANEILLRHKAEHDELTGLINRTAYNRLKKALSFTEEKIALIIVDVDFFKLINDNNGHVIGDKVLKFVSDVLMENFRATDYVARVGGDEFSIIMTQCDPNIKTTEKLIEKKMKAIKEKLFRGEPGLPAVTVSCGIALSSIGYTEQLYEHADSALYDVKRDGRNGFSIYREKVDFQ